MSDKLQLETQALVQRILENSSSYEELATKLETLGEEDRSILLSLLRGENPPLLGTGPVQ